MAGYEATAVFCQAMELLAELLAAVAELALLDNDETAFHMALENAAATGLMDDPDVAKAIDAAKAKLARYLARKRS